MPEIIPRTYELSKKNLIHLTLKTRNKVSICLIRKLKQCAAEYSSEMLLVESCPGTGPQNSRGNWERPRMTYP